MAKYIDKDKIAAEIKKRYEYWREKEHNSHSIESEARMSECQHLMLLFNTIETKEVDLEKELETLDRILFDLDGVAIAGTTCYLTVEDVKDIAKQFYELGLFNAQKGN